MGMPKGIIIMDELANIPADGLRSFAVWTERDVANDCTVIRKVEEFDPTRRYPPSLSGVIRAKDELDVYRFIKEYDSDRDNYK